MEDTRIYNDISQRTGGDIYIGVVGPVRTGKSTLIKRFMDTLIIPNISGKYSAERAIDEMPQSAAGRTIMTTEPKFIPEEAVEVTVEDTATFRVRMIDCVGYIVPSSLGYIENNAPRMVKTPWFEEEIPFNLAAEIGTRKVIEDHSTIGMVVTTDGSISDIPREEYEEVEERVISELRELRKPFVVLLNSVNPQSEGTISLAKTLSDRYGVTVRPVSCQDLDETEIRGILSSVLMEFPIKSISVNLPRWLCSLEKEHWLKSDIYRAMKECAHDGIKLKEVPEVCRRITGSQNVVSAKAGAIELGTGKVKLDVSMLPNLFYKIIGEKTGMEIADESALMRSMLELSGVKRKYDRVSDALEQVESTGYGIVMPSLEELTLEEPEMMSQSGRYGVRLKASAPSIHMMRANITTEVAPVVGSEKQSEELVYYLLNGFEENPSTIWESNIFGKSLHELVNEGLHNKLFKMPDEARGKFQETIERVINEGCNGLICIIL
ncbi:MAG: stage IV sporulation protein A [Oscillospiraceae bacterium]|jgi:stage IV sporulation protein A|nr:stage IV sporulation protein A [Oscillospiraceae bacterium]